MGLPPQVPAVVAVAVVVAAAAAAVVVAAVAAAADPLTGEVGVLVAAEAQGLGGEDASSLYSTFINPGIFSGSPSTAEK